ERVEGVEEQRLVLLEVLLVPGRQSLEQAEDGRDVARETSGLATRQLEAIRVPLLRHQTRAGGVRLGQADEGELLRRVEDQVLGQPREVRGDERRDEDEL